ncbi:MAG: glucose dehydrogenase [Hyphomonadaceae bacterium]|jgi:glucose/arabinose dehydrogenase|uniref:PQQ-dependent sugar dehydrogenase n=1 Tax=uncultured Henriciella sp. TaxID=1608424 RepID=UPI000C6770F5|nr:glucose dehydrogenase [Hyphomonadaceae bacterium]|tara:strand:+ start:1381 stop:2505 length:1125 start_codon:yes stop_codon:yes gene_type:complete
MSVTGTNGTELTAEVLESFDHGWAMTFLPDGRALVSELTGSLWLLDEDGSKIAEIANVPETEMRNQGGLGDIIIHPDFANNNTVFLSYVERDEADDTLSGAVVVKATLELTEDGGSLSDVTRIWEQSQKLKGNGHYSHRLAVAPDGNLIITSGERQHFSPAQNMDINLGKVIRVTTDGEPVEDNPFYGNGGIADTIWSLGHRNMLGVAFDGDGQLWVHEMGPKGGDELNRIVRGENYGYPIVSNGEHYNGKQFFGNHEDFPIYENPAISWTPVISPAGLIIYDGDTFGDWQGDAFIGGLSSRALIRVEFVQTPLDNQGSGGESSTMETTANEAERYEWDKRIREVEQGPDGAIYVIEDKEGGRLLRLTPAAASE